MFKEIKTAGVRVKDDDCWEYLYSLRHTYIPIRLGRHREATVSVHFLTGLEDAPPKIKELSINAKKEGYEDINFYDC